MPAAHLDPARKHTAVLLFDATDSNPNGDPDAGNQPRTDPETGQGLVSDVSIKRKIRDTVAAVTEGRVGSERYAIFITAGTSLNANLRRSAEAVGATAKTKSPKKDPSAAGESKEAEQQAWLREHFFDVRMFGGVLSTGDFPAGKLTGPVQIEWARSVEPVVATEHTITRVARTSENDDPNSQIGAKWLVPYGLYITRVHYSPYDGRRAGVTSDDLDVLWQTLLHAFDHTRSAARPNMSTVGLHIFSHRNPLGDAAPRAISAAIEVQHGAVTAARSAADYTIAVDTAGLPDSMTLTSLGT